MKTEPNEDSGMFQILPLFAQKEKNNWFPFRRLNLSKDRKLQEKSSKKTSFVRKKNLFLKNAHFSVRVFMKYLT